MLSVDLHAYLKRHFKTSDSIKSVTSAEDLELNFASVQKVMKTDGSRYLSV